MKYIGTENMEEDSFWRGLTIAIARRNALLRDSINGHLRLGSLSINASFATSSVLILLERYIK